MTPEQLPLTLMQAKDLIARGQLRWRKDYYFTSWDDMVNSPFGKANLESLLDKAAELYCQSHKAKAWEEGSDAQFKKSWNFEREDKERIKELEAMLNEWLLFDSRIHTAFRIAELHLKTCLIMENKK